MFKPLKYVILACPAGEHPVIFPNDPDGLIHKEVAWTAGVAVGAGFCHPTPNGWVCEGVSYSLNVKSRGTDDEKLLDKFFPIFS